MSSTLPLKIIGLGNPGPKFKNTRHNVGHMLADHLLTSPALQKLLLENKISIYKSSVYMNLSGSYLKTLIKRGKVG